MAASLSNANTKEHKMNECETIMKELGPMPELPHSVQDNPEATFRPQALWIIDLARKHLYADFQTESTYRVLQSEIKRQNLSPNAAGRLFDILEHYLETARPKNDLVLRLLYWVKDFELKVGQIPVPYFICEEYRLLWLSLLLSGVNGRKFKFGHHAYADALSLNIGTIAYFLKQCRRYNVIVSKEREDSLCIYQLDKKYWQEWQMIEPVNGTEKPSHLQALREWRKYAPERLPEFFSNAWS